MVLPHYQSHSFTTSRLSSKPLTAGAAANIQLANFVGAASARPRSVTAFHRSPADRFRLGLVTWSYNTSTDWYITIELSVEDVAAAGLKIWINLPTVSADRLLTRDLADWSRRTDRAQLSSHPSIGCHLHRVCASAATLTSLLQRRDAPAAAAAVACCCWWWCPRLFVSAAVWMSCSVSCSTPVLMQRKLRGAVSREESCSPRAQQDKTIRHDTARLKFCLIALIRRRLMMMSQSAVKVKVKVIKVKTDDRAWARRYRHVSCAEERSLDRFVAVEMCCNATAMRESAAAVSAQSRRLLMTTRELLIHSYTFDSCSRASACVYTF